MNSDNFSAIQRQSPGLRRAATPRHDLVDPLEKAYSEWNTLKKQWKTEFEWRINQIYTPGAWWFRNIIFGHENFILAFAAVLGVVCEPDVGLCVLKISPPPPTSSLPTVNNAVNRHRGEAHHGAKMFHHFSIVRRGRRRRRRRQAQRAFTFFTDSCWCWHILGSVM